MLCTWYYRKSVAGSHVGNHWRWLVKWVHKPRLIRWKCFLDDRRRRTWEWNTAFPYLFSPTNRSAEFNKWKWNPVYPLFKEMKKRVVCVTNFTILSHRKSSTLCSVHFCIFQLRQQKLFLCSVFSFDFGSFWAFSAKSRVWYSKKLCQSLKWHPSP